MCGYPVRICTEWSLSSYAIISQEKATFLRMQERFATAVLLCTVADSQAEEECGLDDYTNRSFPHHHAKGIQDYNLESHSKSRVKQPTVVTLPCQHCIAISESMKWAVLVHQYMLLSNVEIIPSKGLDLKTGALKMSLLKHTTPFPSYRHKQTRIPQAEAVFTVKKHDPLARKTRACTVTLRSATDNIFRRTSCFGQ